MTKNKKVCLVTVLAFSLAELFVFSLFHIPNFVLMQSTEFVEYTRIFLTKFTEFLMPIAAATVLFFGYREVGLKKTLIRAIYLSLPRIIYSLPYYYLYYIVNWYDSLESVALSALVTAFGVALFYGQILLLFWLIRVFARIPLIHNYKKELPLNLQKKTPKNLILDFKRRADDEAVSSFSDRAVFNFSSPSALGIFAAVFASFCINFVREAADTVIYLVEYAGDYYIEEIIYITACYLFLIAELLICQLICCGIRNLLNKEKEIE